MTYSGELNSRLLLKVGMMLNMLKHVVIFIKCNLTKQISPQLSLRHNALQHRNAIEKRPFRSQTPTGDKRA